MKRSKKMRRRRREKKNNNPEGNKDDRNATNAYGECLRSRTALSSGAGQGRHDAISLFSVRQGKRNVEGEYASELSHAPPLGEERETRRRAGGHERGDANEDGNGALTSGRK